MQINTIKPEDLPQQGEPTKVRKVREAMIEQPSSPVKQIIPDILGGAVEKQQVATHLAFTPLQGVDLGEYSIPYEPLCGSKIPEVPAKLNYKPLNGFHVTKINELNMETVDDGLNDVLDALCYESKMKGFTHWTMSTNEKIRAFLNLRLNSVGPIIEHLVGVCTECGEQKLFTKILLTKFDETELKADYQEPFPLKYNSKGKVEHKFKARILRSGDIKRARQIFNLDKSFVAKFFPDIKKEDESTVILILEYANTILEHEGSPAMFEQAVSLCRDNAELMNAVTSFNDYFAYGMNLTSEETCDNKECPSNLRKDPNTDKTVGRSLFRIPTQPTIFSITSSEKEAVIAYFDL